MSYFEWVRPNQAYWWSAAPVDERLEHRMLTAWQHLLEVAAARRLTLRQAAAVTAVERVADAHRTRGLHP